MKKGPFAGPKTRNEKPVNQDSPSVDNQKSTGRLFGCTLHIAFNPHQVHSEAHFTLLQRKVALGRERVRG